MEHGDFLQLCKRLPQGNHKRNGLIAACNVIWISGGNLLRDAE